MRSKQEKILKFLYKLYQKKTSELVQSGCANFYKKFHIVFIGCVHGET